MNLHRIGKTAERFVTDNSPMIMTALGIAGTLGTAYLASKASFKASKVLEDERYAKNIKRLAAEKQIELDNKEKFLLIWKLYIPAAGVATLTIASVVFANRIGMRRTAAMAAMASLSEKAFTEYKDKVAEKVGEKKHQEIRDELAQDRVNRDYDPMRDVMIDGKGKVLCHDAYSGRFFYSTIETIRKAVNDINMNIRSEDSQTVSDFYDMIGLRHTSMSDEFGWNIDDPLTLVWTTCTPDVDGAPAAHSYDFETRPILRPWSAKSFR